MDNLQGLALPLNRVLTKQFIDVNPITVSLVPHTRVKLSNGGYKVVEGAPRSPQIFTLIEPGDSGARIPLRTDNTVERIVEFTLLGEYDCVMEIGDTFRVGPLEYEVIELLHENGYERRGFLSRSGRA